MLTNSKKVLKLVDSILTTGEKKTSVDSETLKLAQELKCDLEGLTLDSVFDILRMFIALKKPAKFKDVARELKVDAINLFHFVQDNKYNFDLAGDRIARFWNDARQNPKNPEHPEYLRERFKNCVILNKILDYGAVLGYEAVAGAYCNVNNDEMMKIAQECGMRKITFCFGGFGDGCNRDYQVAAKASDFEALKAALAERGVKAVVR